MKHVAHTFFISSHLLLSTLADMPCQTTIFNAKTHQVPFISLPSNGPHLVQTQFRVMVDKASVTCENVCSGMIEFHIDGDNGSDTTYSKHVASYETDIAPLCTQVDGGENKTVLDMSFFYNTYIQLPPQYPCKSSVNTGCYLLNKQYTSITPHAHMTSARLIFTNTYELYNASTSVYCGYTVQPKGGCDEWWIALASVFIVIAAICIGILLAYVLRTWFNCPC